MNCIPALTTFMLANVLAQSGGDYDLSWSVISSGGVTFSTDGNFQLGSTIGQPVVLGASPCTLVSSFGAIGDD